MMRALGLIACIGVLAGGCTKTLTCKPGTLLLTLHLDGDVAQADQLSISVSIDGGAPSVQMIPHHTGEHDGAVEIDFASYPQGSSLTVIVTALANGQPVGATSGAVTLTGGCVSWALTVGVGGIDLSGSIDDLALPDLAVGELAASDAAADLSPAIDLSPILDLWQGNLCDGGAQCGDGGFCSPSSGGELVCCNEDCTGPCVAPQGCLGGTCYVQPSSAPCSANYLCNGVSPKCPTTCSGNGGCVAGDYCSAPNCVACTADGDCGPSCHNCTGDPDNKKCVQIDSAYQCGCTGTNTGCTTTEYCNIAGGQTNGTCATCNQQTHCSTGSSCVDCKNNASYNGNGTLCKNPGASQPCGCAGDLDCLTGYYCTASGTCAQCTVPGHCGYPSACTTCAAAGSNNSNCVNNGGSYICGCATPGNNGGDCAAADYCASGKTCVACNNTSANCLVGSTCTNCGSGSNSQCIVNGGTHACGCSGTANGPGNGCTATQFCSSGSCATCDESAQHCIQGGTCTNCSALAINTLCVSSGPGLFSCGCTGNLNGNEGSNGCDSHNYCNAGSCAPCGSVDPLHCKANAGTCFDCIIPGDPFGSACKNPSKPDPCGCNSSGDCTLPDLYCDSGTHTCLTCQVGTACNGSSTSCNDPSCGGGNLYCNLMVNQCEDCSSDGDDGHCGSGCQDCLSMGMFCNQSNVCQPQIGHGMSCTTANCANGAQGQCMQCQGNAPCVGNHC
jgi:hypothetical protein